jgi:hypothetical protein
MNPDRTRKINRKQAPDLTGFGIGMGIIYSLSGNYRFLGINGEMFDQWVDLGNERGRFVQMC